MSNLSHSVRQSKHLRFLLTLFFWSEKRKKKKKGFPDSAKIFPYLIKVFLKLNIQTYHEIAEGLEHD